LFGYNLSSKVPESDKYLLGIHSDGEVRPSSLTE
jgi:hypothetical protein